MKKCSLLLAALLCAMFFGCAPKGYRGTVTDENDAPLAGVRVSDGFQVVLTGKDGKYVLPLADEKANKTVFNISVVTPADRAVKCFWQPVEEERLDGYDFKLTKCPKRDHFSFVQFSDLETGGNSLQYYFDTVRDRIHAEPDAAFVVFSGDICREGGIKKESEEFNAEMFGGLPAYITLGNHDLVQSECGGEALFEELLGPTRAAFIEGNVLFVLLPMAHGDANPGYNNADVAGFVKSLLATWPKGQPVFFVCHGVKPYFSRSAKFLPGTPQEFDLADWKLSGMIYEHTHWYSAYPDLPLPIWNVGQSHGGGAGNMPGGARLFHVDENGVCTTEIIESRVEKPLFSTLVDKAGNLTAVAYYSGGKCTSVTAQVDEKTVDLKQVTPWLWEAQVPANHGAIQLEGTFRVGDAEQKLAASCNAPAESDSLALEKIITLPGKTLFGSPVVDGNRIYVGVADEDNAKLGGVYAFDAVSGKELWKFVTGYSVRNSLVFDKKMLYFNDADNNVYKVAAADGKLIWKHSFPLDSFNENCHNAPALGDGKVFSGCAAYLQALDQETGKPVWQNSRSFEEFGSTMAPLYLDGKVYLGSNWGNEFLALNASDGSIAWSSEEVEQGFRFQPTMTVLPDGNILRAEERGFTVHDAKTGKFLKKMEKPELLSTTSVPLIYKNLAICGANTRGVVAVDLNSMTKKWDLGGSMGMAILGTVQYRGPMVTEEATPALAKDKLICPGGNGILYTVEPESGKIENILPVGAPFLSQPVYADGKLFVADYAGRILIFFVK